MKDSADYSSIFLDGSSPLPFLRPESSDISWARILLQTANALWCRMNKVLMFYCNILLHITY